MFSLDNHPPKRYHPTMPISNQQLASDIQSVRTELEACEAHHYVACAPSTEALRTLLDSWDKAQQDIEQLALLYTAQIKADAPLLWWAELLCKTIRPAKKGRAYVSAEAADKLKEAVQNYRKTDAVNRMMERSDSGALDNLCATANPEDTEIIDLPPAVREPAADPAPPTETTAETK